MILTHPITTSVLTHLVLNMHKLIYKQSLADLDVNSHEAPLDPDSDLELACSDIFPPILDEAETLTEEIGATTIRRDANLRSGPEKANNWRYGDVPAATAAAQLHQVSTQCSQFQRPFGEATGYDFWNSLGRLGT